MVVATQGFMDSLEKWLKAVRADDFAAAKQNAQNLTKAGKLLTIHPDFIKCFQAHCNGFETKEALFHMCQFLLCATDGRARHLKKWIQDNKPEVV